MFDLRYTTGSDRDSCDVCNKVVNTEPLMILEWRGREGHSIIFIHERCLNKRLAKAKKAVNV